jgi:PAS domain S-box-containing protein
MVTVGVVNISQGVLSHLEWVSSFGPALQLTVPAIAATGGAWLWFCTSYAGLDGPRIRRTRQLVATVLAVVAVGSVLPYTVSLYIREFRVVEGGLVVTPGPAAAVLGAVYLLSLLGGSLAILQLYFGYRHHKIQSSALLVTRLLPWLAVLALVGNYFDSQLTPTLVTLVMVDVVRLSNIAIPMALMAISLYRYDLDVVPVARDDVVDYMGDGVIVVADSGTISDSNPAAREMLTSGDQNILGRQIADVFPGWEDLSRSTYESPAWQDITNTVAGVQYYLEAQLLPVSDYHDRVAGTLVVLRDVTDRERREQALQRYKTIFESVEDRVFVLDAENRFQTVNQPLASFLGADQDALVGEPFETFLAQPLPDTDSDVLRFPDDEVTIVTRSGEEIPCEVQFSRIEFGDENENTVGVLRNISRLKETERTLSELTERFQTLVDASPLAIVATNRSGTVEIWNPAASRIFGYERQTTVGSELPMIPDENAERIENLHRRVLDGEELTDEEVQFEHADGDRIDCSLSMAPIVHQGQIVGSVAVIADTTERKARREQIERQNERLMEFSGLSATTCAIRSRSRQAI